MARIRSKYAFKKFAGKCAFCPEPDYACLDVHRIHEGYKGGKYSEWNHDEAVEAELERAAAERRRIREELRKAAQ